MTRTGWTLIALLSTAGLFIAATMTYYHYSLPERRENLQRIFPFIQHLYASEARPSGSPFGPPPSATFHDPTPIGSLSGQDSSRRPDLPFCDVSGRLSCARVDESPYSVFFGVPVPLIGFFGYLQFFVIAIAGTLGRPLPVPVRRYFLIISTVAFLFTAYLNAIEAFVIRAFCPWCIASTAVTLGITLPTFAKAKSFWVR
ncbi:MAG: vitamin K epoxide reductase family protein [bacterium JZ-2024 1]